MELNEGIVKAFNSRKGVPEAGLGDMASFLPGMEMNVLRSYLFKGRAAAIAMK